MAHPPFRVFRSHFPAIKRLQVASDLAAHRRSVLLAFAGLGVHVGIWTVLLADLVTSLSLSTRTLGHRFVSRCTGCLLYARSSSAGCSDRWRTRAEHGEMARVPDLVREVCSPRLEWRRNVPSPASLEK